MRLRVLLVSLGLIVGAAGSSSAGTNPAGSRPARSGTIAGGAGLDMGGGEPWENPALERYGCEYAAECRTWLHSGCNPALAGHDPVLTASIVDVSNLADGRTRRYIRMKAPRIPPWGLWPGAVVQLWRADCTEIRSGSRPSTGSTRCEWRGGAGSCAAFRIPAGARWMTVSGDVTTVQLSWALF